LPDKICLSGLWVDLGMGFQRLEGAVDMNMKQLRIMYKQSMMGIVIRELERMITYDDHHRKEVRYDLADTIEKTARRIVKRVFTL